MGYNIKIGDNTFNNVTKIKAKNATDETQWIDFIGGGAPQLDAPVVTLSDTTISWAAVTGAEFYKVYKDNVIISIISGTSVENITAGSYKVKAIASGYIDSEFSNEIITNLTNTVWKFNSDSVATGTPTHTDTDKAYWEVNITSDGTSYTRLGYSTSSNSDNIRVYGSSYYQLIGLKQITIVSGTDVENQNLVSWLKANATKIS